MQGIELYRVLLYSLYRKYEADVCKRVVICFGILFFFNVMNNGNQTVLCVINKELDFP